MKPGRAMFVFFSVSMPSDGRPRKDLQQLRVHGAVAVGRERRIGRAVSEGERRGDGCALSEAHRIDECLTDVHGHPGQILQVHDLLGVVKLLRDVLFVPCLALKDDERHVVLFGQRCPVAGAQEHLRLYAAVGEDQGRRTLGGHVVGHVDRIVALVRSSPPLWEEPRVRLGVRVCGIDRYGLSRGENFIL